MFRANANVRTVWVKDLQIEKRQGNDGEYDSKTILFRVATQRNYKRTVEKDGQQVSEYPTDFITCRANGEVAQRIADYCSATDESGKFISRRLNIFGSIICYKGDRRFENVHVNVNGVDGCISFNAPQDNYMFIVDEFEFLDPPPKKDDSNNTSGISNVSFTTQPQTANTQGQTAQAPVQAQPAPQNATQAQPTVQVQQVMNPPTIPEGYDGEECPFK